MVPTSPRAHISTISNGGAIQSTKTGTGTYRIFIPRQANPKGGTVHVSAYGRSSYCKPVVWGTKDGGREIVVNCYAPHGELADGKFTLLYLNEPDVGENGAAYVWADKESSAIRYVPRPIYQWSKSGAQNTVQRIGHGRYVVSFPQSGSHVVAGGTMMVSAYGGSPTRCQVGDWIIRDSAVEAAVYCFKPNGTPVDSKFTAVFVRDPSLGTKRVNNISWPLHGAYMWAHGHTRAETYTPIKKYQFEAENQVTRRGPGQYEVRLRKVKPSNRSGAFVTVYGKTPALCSVGGWSQWREQNIDVGTRVLVRCTDSNGQPSDVQFTLLYQTDDRQPATTFSHKINLQLDAEGYKLQKVFYGTDRVDAGPSVSVKQRYTHERDYAEQFSYGIASVSIPHDHQMGQLESPILIENPEEHVALLELEDMGRAEFLDTLRDTLQSFAGEKQALVFIHGYRVSFEDAARRTAQMTYDLEFEGPAIFYSWPSRTSTVQYAADEDNIQWSTPHIRDFIKDVIRETGVDKVHLIAHSMGTRGLTAALRAQRDGLSQEDFAKINTIMLAAPDIDAYVFVRDIVPEIRDHGHVTVYASDNDQALNASSALHRSYRTGIIDHLRRILPAEVDVIDASQVRTNYIDLGHAYYGDNASIITDMRKILRGETGMDERCHLVEMNTENGRYWFFNDGPCEG